MTGSFTAGLPLPSAVLALGLGGCVIDWAGPISNPPWQEGAPAGGDPSTVPVDDTGTSPTDDTGTSPTDDTGTSPTDDTGTSPTDDTSTSPTDDTSTSPADDTETSPADDTETSPTDDTSTSLADDTSTSPTDDTGPAPADDSSTSTADDSSISPVNDTGPAPTDDSFTSQVDDTGPAPTDDTDVPPVKDTGFPPLDDSSTSPADDSEPSPHGDSGAPPWSHSSAPAGDTAEAGDSGRPGDSAPPHDTALTSPDDTGMATQESGPPDTGFLVPVDSPPGTDTAGDCVCDTAALCDSVGCCADSACDTGCACEDGADSGGAGDTGQTITDDSGTPPGGDSGAADSVPPHHDSGDPHLDDSSSFPVDDTARGPDTGLTVGPDSPPGGSSDSGDSGDSVHTPADDSTHPADTGSPTDTGDTGAPSSGPTRFVALGDAGTGMSMQYSVGDAIYEVCQVQGCDFALYLGDNFYPSGVRSATDSRFSTYFELPYSDLDFDFLVSLGNHDWGNSTEYQVQYTAYSDHWFLPDQFYSEVRGDATFFAFDTNALALDIGADQIAWFPAAVAAATTPWRIAFGHHPYQSNGPHGNAGEFDGSPGEGAGFQDFMEDEVCPNIDIYFAGHDHNLQWLEPDPACGAEIIVSGGGGAGTYNLGGSNPSYFENETYGFVWVELDGDTMTAAFYDETGAELYRGSYTR